MRWILCLFTMLLFTGCASIIYFLFRPDFIDRIDIDLRSLEPVSFNIDLENHKKGRGRFRNDKVGPYSVYLSDRTIRKNDFFQTKLYELVSARNDTAIFVKGDTPLFKGGIKVQIVYDDGKEEQFTLTTWSGQPRVRWHEPEIPVGRFWLHRTKNKSRSRVTLQVLGQDRELVPLIQKPYLIITKGDDR